MMKRMLGLIAASVSVLVLGAASAGSAADAKAPYKIGVIMPLTGNISWLGEYQKKGSEVRAEMINKAGGVNGRPIELVFYDDQSSPETGTRVAQRLISNDRVVAITGTGTAVVSAAVASVANKAKVPAVLQSGYSLSEKDIAGYVFNNAHRTDYAIERPMMYFQKKGVTKVALLMPIGPLGELGSGIARKYAPQHKIEIVGEEKFDVKAPDVTAQLAKLRALNPQAIFAFATGEPAALVARSMDQLDMTVPLVVSHGNATPGFLKLVAQTTTPVIVPTGKIMAIEMLKDNDPVKKVIAAFAAEYQKKYNEPANYYAGQSGDSIAMVAEALRVAGSDDPDKLKAALEGLKNFPGCNGTYNLSATDHQGTKMDDMILMTIKGGKWYHFD
ncbi:MAG: ABC transporter substrate-binding protein [Deltaproteobacteria bacterium]|nr:ABC transporter substrate-binding protein [Deltaproteobacteria bacterium]